MAFKTTQQLIVVGRQFRLGKAIAHCTGESPNDCVKPKTQF